MKLIHLSDLHLGKRVNEFSMMEDQKYILKQILQRIDEEQPDGVILAGDIYDKPVPPAEAVELFDEFLVDLSRRGLQTFIISGNHDSAERLAFGGRLMEGSGIHFAPVFDAKVAPLHLEDELGTVDVFLLPFVKPAHVRRFFEAEAAAPRSGSVPETVLAAAPEIKTYTDAIRAAITCMDIDPSHRNVLVTHQFVTGAVRSDSEETSLSVGGTDNVDAAVFSDFDYVALGHIHRPQNMGGGSLIPEAGDGSDQSLSTAGLPLIRYCGTPLKYSFSEANHENTSYPADYVHITLTDEEYIPEAMGRLRVIYPYLMKLDYDNRRTRTSNEIQGASTMEDKTPGQLFAEFYELQNNAPLTDEQEQFLTELIGSIWRKEGAN